MRRILKTTMVLVLIFTFTLLAVYTVNMIGNSVPTVSAAYIDDLMEICHILSTDITTQETNWGEFWLCVAKGLT